MSAPPLQDTAEVSSSAALARHTPPLEAALPPQQPVQVRQSERSVRCSVTTRAELPSTQVGPARGDSAAPPESGTGQRFEDRGLVASGGMGAVHLAYDKLMLRHVALKFLIPDAPAEPIIEQQFIEEAQITGQLDHPNIVPVYDLALSSDSNRCFFSMKFVDGQTYAQLINDYHQSGNNHDSLYKLLQVFLRVCDAISFAHERGVIHCDLKPDNVMVGTHGQVYVMDWGVAVLREATRPSNPSGNQAGVHLVGDRRDSESIGGTFGFMSPEQAWGRSQDVDPRTDVYGLGGMLYYLLTQEPPHDEKDGYGDFGAVTPVAVRTTRSELPPVLCRIAERALSVEREARPQSVDELRAEVEAFIAGGGWFGERRYVAGEVILREGEHGDSAFIITEGQCDIWKQQATGSSLLRTIGAGEVFGELAVLTNNIRSATVIAQTAVSVRVITRASLEQELRRNPLLGTFMQAVADRFCELERNLKPTPDPG